MKTVVTVILALSMMASGAMGQHVLHFPFDHDGVDYCAMANCYSGHQGIDYFCPEGTDIYAGISGVVVDCRNSIQGQDCDENFGNFVKIQNDLYNIQVLEAHMLYGSVTVTIGEYVTAGQIIGKSSNTGFTSTLVNGSYQCGYGGGYHLHFETRLLIDNNWTAVNPYSYNGGLWTSPLQYGDAIAYLFGLAHDRNGGDNAVGTANGPIYDYGSYKRQDFSGGSYYDCCIMYDPHNGHGNPLATNEAYLIRTGFYNYYETHGGGEYLGCPTRDEYSSRDPEHWDEEDEYPLQNFMIGHGSSAEQHYMIYKSNEAFYKSTYATHWVTQDPNVEFPMQQGATRQVTVKFRNESEFTWRNNQSSYPYDYIALKSVGSNGAITESFFNYPYDGSLGWIDVYTPCTMQESSVAPGDTATFTFNVKVRSTATPGIYQVHFRPYHSLGGLLDDWGGMHFYVNVISHEDDYCDLASVYAYTNSTKIHTWLSNGDGFYYQGDDGWWASTTYPGDSVVHVMSGDFDDDGTDDIAVVQNKIISGTPKARVQVWLSNGYSFSFEDAWWAASGGYNALSVVHAKAGDFNGDGKCDVALVYDYGWTGSKYETRVHVLVSSGSSFSLQSWYTSSGSYNAQNIRHCVAQDFTGDGKCDLVFFYDYGLVDGQYQFRSHVLVSSGSDFSLQSWYTNTNYNIDDVTQAVGGDFNDDGKGDVVFVHYDDASTTSLQVLQSSGTAFSKSTWWTSGGSYGADHVERAAGGDFDGDGKDDVMLAYAYSTVWVRFHTFLSTGSAFTLDGGSNGWWEATAYGITNYVRGIVAGHFNPPSGGAGKRTTPGESYPPIVPSAFSLQQNYPNPFNPATTISYSLLEATHVRLEVFNILGQRVDALLDADQPAGEYQLTWDASRFASGIYFYRLQTEAAVETKKMLLLK